MPDPVGTGWTIDADSSERSEVRVGGVLCDEVRTNQARSPGAIKGLASRD
jgi:nucleoside-triphosphatase THEP1